MFPRRQLPTFGPLLVLGLALFVQACAPARPEVAPGAQGSASRRQVLQTEAFFRQTDAPRLRIQISDQGIDSLRQNPRTYVRAVVSEGGATYNDVAVHLRGHVGSFRPIEERPGFTLNFHRFVPGQKFYGLNKLHLVNSEEDETRCREILVSRLFRAAGVPAARETVARVALNGRDLGMYVLKEGINHRFFKLYFSNPDGAIYEPGTVDDIDVLTPKPKRRNTITGDLKAVVEAAEEPDPAARLKRLEGLVDLDRFISFIAMEALTADWDSYSLNTNNYRVYFDPETRRFVFMPGEAQEALMDTATEFYPVAGGLLAEAVLQTEEGRRRYDERMEELFRTRWRRDAMIRSVKEIQAKIRTALLPEELEDHDYAIADLLARIDEQDKRLQAHFAQVHSRIRFESTGVAQVGGWTPRIDAGRPVLETSEERGSPLLHVAVKNGAGSARWSAKVVLRDGQYRFEALVRTAAVSGPGAGVSIGAGDHKSPERLTGDQPWRKLGVEFKVDKALDEVELACAVSAAAGEAWFDSGSLMLFQIAAPP